MTKQKILVVEDDKHISKLVKYNLEKAGFDCNVSITGEDALAVLAHQSYDLVILDIMLPKIDGFETCRQIRQDNKLANIPIIMVTAKGEEVDKVVGFELGSDDYVVKPFSPRELILRVKAILKRGKAKENTEENEIISSSNISIDIARHQVKIDEKEVILTQIEFNLLVTLIKRQGRVQSRDRLLKDVWDMDSDVTTRTIDTHIKRLREKLGKSGKLINTVRGIGYKFSEEDQV
ncbi:MAG: response regulator transcription factor [Candidatus Omnitrophica bacterium]|nr:response regulator transcription factor [Candidatus Omnitrophota bacterium]